MLDRNSRLLVVDALHTPDASAKSGVGQRTVPSNGPVVDRASSPQKGSCSGSGCIDLAAQRRPASRRFWKLISRFQGRRNVERSDFRMLALRTHGQPLGPRPRQEAVCPGGQCWVCREKSTGRILRVKPIRCLEPASQFESARTPGVTGELTAEEALSSGSFSITVRSTSVGNVESVFTRSAPISSDAGARVATEAQRRCSGPAAR
jgi:hypothetical protein